jgi:hypothetical protein
MAHKKRVANAGSAAAKAQEFPPSILSLINGSIIDISEASDFYKKKAEIATLLSDFVEKGVERKH